MPRRGKWEQHPELLTHRSREGVITARDLQSLGMDPRTIYRKCLPGGPWQRLLPGIILLHNGGVTRRQRALAALLYGGPGAMITGADACRWYDLRVPDEFPAQDIHLLIPHERRVLSSEYVVAERTRRLPGAWIRRGLPLAPLVRATTDAVRRIRAEEPISHLLVEAIQHGRCLPAELTSELDVGTKRGTAIPRRLLKEWTDLRSVAEIHAKKLSARLTTEPTHWNTGVRTASGFVGRPDAWWDEVALAWEIDSFEFHYTRHDYARTLRRNNRYAAAGIKVVQTLPTQIRDAPEEVLHELESAYAAAAARSRPPVYLVEEEAA
ncbi:hypothetical protein MUY14_32560 [Amycolatopsis sp. FBCC-B4732]|uniref:hypothetical protein n=1 Tax=Amycolatopsis sp. FBCC-B4732 TaxID=3079339 RepID=UPI001FF3E1A9|nr:hypothetical protein [Amycolatopsis sp. FBCC-B4732]UOX86459.1 hypothetical protein MUY14_32560 [Amycolatopsis sp. FBCC-B4732]